MDKSIAARRKAQQMARDGQIGRAIDEMERILQSEETDPYDFVFHGDLLVRGGRQDEAVSIYEEAVSAYERIGLYRNAIAICKKVLRVQPSRCRVHRRLGDLYAKEGLLGDAVEQFLYFLDHADGESPAEEFIETLERVSEIAGSRIEVKLRLADLYAKAGHGEQAARFLDEVAEQAAGGGGAEIARALRDRVRHLTGASPGTSESVSSETGRGADRSAPPAGAAGADGANSEEPALGDGESSFVFRLENDLGLDSEPGDLEEAGAESEGGMSAGAEGASENEASTGGAPAIEGSGGSAGGAIFDPSARFIASAEPIDGPGRAAEDVESAEDIESTEDAESTEDVESTDEAIGDEAPAARADEPLDCESGIDRASRTRGVDAALGQADWRLARERAEALREEFPEDLVLVEKLILACESMGDRLATVRYLILLGDLKINEEDLEGSLACFLQVLDLDPGNATAHRRVARFREMNLVVPDRNAPEAAPGIREVLASGEAQVTVRDHGGSESEEWVDLVDLLQQFQDGVRSLYRPGDYAGHYDLGVSHQEMGLYEEAIEEFDTVLGMDDLPPAVARKAREMRGVCLQNLERHREAIGAFRSVIESEHLTAEERRVAEYRLACSLEAVGEKDEARQLFQALSTPDEPFLDSADRYRRLAGSLPSSA